MSAATVPLSITCPDWCTVSPAEHAESLWDYEGNSIHYGADRVARDTTGFHGALEDPKFHQDAHVYMTSCTRPDGVETSPPVVHLAHGDEMSIQQALDLAAAITAAVDQYRACGGVA